MKARAVTVIAVVFAIMVSVSVVSLGIWVYVGVSVALDSEDLVGEIKIQEGFRGLPYDDTRGASHHRLGHQAPNHQGRGRMAAGDSPCRHSRQAREGVGALRGA